jgi:hypothetical protein
LFLPVFLVLGVLGVSFVGVLVLVWCCSAAVLLGYLGRRRHVFGFGWGAVFFVSLCVFSSMALGLAPEVSILFLMELALESVVP